MKAKKKSLLKEIVKSVVMETEWLSTNLFSSQWKPALYSYKMQKIA